MMKYQRRENTQAQAIAPNQQVQKKNHSYAIYSRGDQEDSPDVVTSMLQEYSIDVYAALDPGLSLSFVTPLLNFTCNSMF